MIARFAGIFTHFAMAWGVLPLTVMIAFSFVLCRQWQVLLFWMLTFSGGSLIGTIANLLWHRTRPHL